MSHPPTPPPRSRTTSALPDTPGRLAKHTVLALAFTLCGGALSALPDWAAIFKTAPAGGIALVFTALVVVGFAAALQTRTAIGAHHLAVPIGIAVLLMAGPAWLLPAGTLQAISLTALMLLAYGGVLALYARRPYDGTDRLAAISVTMAVVAVVAAAVQPDGRIHDVDTAAALQLLLALVTVAASIGMVVSQGWRPTRAATAAVLGSLILLIALTLSATAGASALSPGPLLPAGAALLATGLLLGDRGTPAVDHSRLTGAILGAGVVVSLATLVVNGRSGDPSAVSNACALLGLATAFTRLVVSSRRHVRTNPGQLGGVDRLTGLPDRYELEAVLERELELAERHDRPVGLLLLDVKSLHEINETLGHRVGDRVLQAFADELAAHADTAVVARLSGASFAMVMRGHSSEQEIRAAVDARRRALPTRLQLDDVSVTTQFVAGLAFYPAHATTVADLLRRTEVALQEAKDGNESLTIYDPARDARSRERLQLAAQLHDGIARDELRLFFQPKIDMATGTVIGAEALVRWRHPDGALLGPEAFLPIAESTGQMDALTNWVLEAALGQVKRWRAHGFALHVAVNISAENLLDSTLPDRLADALARHELRGSSLELEITEELAMADPARTAEIVGKIKELGIGFALDDFGTGYSSLSHLKHLGADVLKIDRSFVSDMTGDEDDRVIVWSILDLARNLGMRAVAEGIESPDAVRMLAMMGCAVGQGFHYARPLDAEAFLQWCIEQRAHGTIRLTSAAMQEDEQREQAGEDAGPPAPA